MKMKLKANVKMEKSKVIKGTQILFSATLFAYLWSLGCASQSKRNVSEKSQFQIPSYTEEVLPNGLRLLVIPEDSLPRFQMNLYTLMGSRDDVPQKQGLSSLTGNLLDRGTKSRTALQISEELNQLGSEIRSTTRTDDTVLRLEGLSGSEDSLLEIFSDVVMHPSFDPKEIERMRSLTLAEHKSAFYNPSTFVTIQSAQGIFGTHPYGQITIGTKESLPLLSRSDVSDHYQKFFRPNRSWLVITGRVSDSFREKVKKTFLEWRSNDVSNFNTQTLSVATPQRRLFHKSDLQQSEVRFASVGIPRNHPDYYPLTLGLYVVGGGGFMQSRLSRKIRDQLGLTYGIVSRAMPGVDTGSIEIATNTRMEKTSELIRETLELLAGLQKSGIDSEELKTAKTFFRAQFPMGLETPDQLADSLLFLRLHKLPDEDLKNRLDSLEKVSLNEVNRVLKQYVAPEKFSITVFSNKDKTEKDLKTQIVGGPNWQVISFVY